MRSLAVGQVALEIEGEDIDGKPMKLSDYREKWLCSASGGLGAAPAWP